MKIELRKNATPTEIREYLERMAEIERQQMVQRRQQRQMAETQQRIIAQQARQAEQLAKHEERIFALEQKMELAEREIAHYKPLLESLEEQYRALDNKIWYLSSKGLPCEGLKKQRNKLSEQMFRMETKVIKAQQAIDLCQAQM